MHFFKCKILTPKAIQKNVVHVYIYITSFVNINWFLCCINHSWNCEWSINVWSWNFSLKIKCESCRYFLLNPFSHMINLQQTTFETFNPKFWNSLCMEDNLLNIVENIVAKGEIAHLSIFFGHNVFKKCSWGKGLICNLFTDRFFFSPICLHSFFVQDFSHSIINIQLQLITNLSLSYAQHWGFGTRVNPQLQRSIIAELNIS